MKTTFIQKEEVETTDERRWTQRGEAVPTDFECADLSALCRRRLVAVQHVARSVRIPQAAGRGPALATSRQSEKSGDKSPHSKVFAVRARTFVIVSQIFPNGILGRVSLRSLRSFAAKPWLCCLLAVLFLGGLASAVHAQSYSIDWFTVDGGGGTSTGGVYAVSGTVGQPDAGDPMAGGQYSLTGGFWSLLAAVQTPGAPLLTITRTTTNTVMVSWPSPSTGFSLQQHTNLITTNWTAAAESVTDNGSIKFIIVNPPAGNRFYRLYKP